MNIFLNMIHPVITHLIPSTDKYQYILLSIILNCSTCSYFHSSLPISNFVLKLKMRMNHKRYHCLHYWCCQVLVASYTHICRCNRGRKNFLNEWFIWMRSRIGWHSFCFLSLQHCNNATSNNVLNSCEHQKSY